MLTVSLEFFVSLVSSVQDMADLLVRCYAKGWEEDPPSEDVQQVTSICVAGLNAWLDVHHHLVAVWPSGCTVGPLRAIAS